MHTFLLLLLPLLYAFTDGFQGGGFGWNQLTVNHGGPLHGRGLYYAGPVVLIVSWLAAGWSAALLAVIWGVYRSVGFPDNTITGKNKRMTLARHGIIVPAVAAWAHFTGHITIMALILMTIYTVAATLIAVDYGKHVDMLVATGKTESPQVYNNFEAVRGLTFGAMAMLLLFTS